MSTATGLQDILPAFGRILCRQRMCHFAPGMSIYVAACARLTDKTARITKSRCAAFLQNILLLPLNILSRLWRSDSRPYRGRLLRILHVILFKNNSQPNRPQLHINHFAPLSILIVSIIAAYSASSIPHRAFPTISRNLCRSTLTPLLLNPFPQLLYPAVLYVSFAVLPKSYPPSTSSLTLSIPLFPPQPAIPLHLTLFISYPTPSPPRSTSLSSPFSGPVTSVSLAPAASRCRRLLRRWLARQCSQHAPVPSAPCHAEQLCQIEPFIVSPRVSHLGVVCIVALSVKPESIEKSCFRRPEKRA